MPEPVAIQPHYDGTRPPSARAIRLWETEPADGNRRWLMQAGVYVPKH